MYKPEEFPRCREMQDHHHTCKHLDESIEMYDAIVHDLKSKKMQQETIKSKIEAIFNKHMKYKHNNTKCELLISLLKDENRIFSRSVHKKIQFFGSSFILVY